MVHDDDPSWARLDFSDQVCGRVAEHRGRPPIRVPFLVEVHKAADETGLTGNLEDEAWEIIVLS